MSALRAVLVAVGVIGLPLHALAAQSLVRRIDARLDAAPYDKSLWGVALADETGRVVYGRNAERMFVPASNTKIVVSAVAAALLPGDFTVQTSVYANGRVQDGQLHGDLVLYGRGDPTFSVRCFATDTSASGTCARDPRAAFDSLAAQLARSGVHTVRGNVIGDGSWFDGELVHPSWESYDLNWWYAAPVSGLGVNDNAVDFRARPAEQVGAPVQLSWSPSFAEIAVENRTRTAADGTTSTIDYTRVPGTQTVIVQGELAVGGRPGTESFALPDPNRYAAAALRAALVARGIAVMGEVGSTTDSTRYAPARRTAPLAEVQSRPLRDWIFPILNTSQNWYAEMLLKQLGRRFRGEGSWKAGLDVERRYLIDSVGIDSTEIALSDASGLAANNLMSPSSFVRLLRHIRAHRGWPTFAAGLPRSGSTGSLRTRFVGTAIEGQVRAKTGSISRTNTLSGFVDLPDGRFLTFSVMANHHAQPSRPTLARIDSVVVEFARRPR